MHVYTSVDFIVYNKNKYRFRYVGEHLQHLILQYQLPNENTYYIHVRIGDDTRGIDDDTRSIGDDTRGIDDDTRGIGDDTRGIGDDDTRGVGDDTRGIGDDTRGIGDNARGIGYMVLETEGVKVRETLMGVLGTCSQGRRSLFYHK